MSHGNLFLYLFVFTAFISGLVMIFTRTIFYAALSLIVCLLSISGIYAMLYAEFLAITQVVIYAGGILVIILFGIMLTNRIAGKALRMQSHHSIPGMIISVSLFLVLMIAYQKTSFISMESEPIQDNHLHQIGKALMSTYVLPFEIAGVLLLVCVIGASLMSSSFKKNDHV